MLQTSHFIVLILLGLGMWIWRDNLAARESAIDSVRRTCRQLGVQLLDQTVAIEWVRPHFSWRGLRLRRRYGFEFSVDGGERFPGRVGLIGHQVVSIQLDGPEGLVME